MTAVRIAVAALLLTAASADAQKIGRVDRGRVDGKPADFLVLRVPISLGDVPVHIGRALEREGFRKEQAEDSLIVARFNRSGICESVPFVVAPVGGGAPVGRPRMDCHVTISVRFAPDSGGSTLRLGGHESDVDTPAHQRYQLRTRNKNWRLIESLARALADTTRR